MNSSLFVKVFHLSFCFVLSKGVIEVDNESSSEVEDETSTVYDVISL